MEKKIDLMKINSLLGDSDTARHSYSAPTLTSFGKVSQLTQAQSGCNQADNPGCTSGDGANDMGSKK